MKIRDVMTDRPITVRSDATIADAARIMLEHRISGLPVLDLDGALVGIITEADIMRRSETDTARHHNRWAELFLSPGRLAQEFIRAHARRVDEVMSPDVTSIDEGMPLEAAVSEMENQRVKRLPVTRAGKLCGMLSRSDLMRAFFNRQAQAAEKPRLSDNEIRDAALREIEKYAWAPGLTVHVIVQHGVATLSGCVTDENVRKALRLVVETIPGVLDVDDEMVTIEPMTGAIVRLPPERSANTGGRS